MAKRLSHRQIDCPEFLASFVARDHLGHGPTLWRRVHLAHEPMAAQRVDLGRVRAHANGTRRAAARAAGPGGKPVNLVPVPRPPADHSARDCLSHSH
jgi:hypothetical protein